MDDAQTYDYLKGLFKETYAPSREDVLASKKPAFIIWNPDYYAPPTAVFQTRADALEAAKKMAEKYAGDSFYVCRLESVTKAPPPPAPISKTEKLK